MSIVPISASGGDDTTALQNGINSTASAHNTLQLQPGAYNTNTLSFPTNADMQLLSGVTVTANHNFPANLPLLDIVGANVTIFGAGATNSIFQMRKTEYTSYQSRHALRINSSGVNNVNVSGCSFNSSGGDGCYVRQASNVTVNNCVFNNNFRTGMAITGQVTNIIFNGCTFSNTAGSLTSSGVDIEPNGPGDFLTDVQLNNCITSGNAGDGILISLWQMDNTSQPVQVFVFGHQSTNDGGQVGTAGGWAAYRALNSGTTNAPGWIIFENCTATTPAYWGAAARFWLANGANLIFKNLTVNNPHVQGPDPDYNNAAAVMIGGGGGNVGPNGNAHFLGVNVSAPNGKCTYYFSFWDATSVGSSQGGPRNCQFLSGNLSGATIGTATVPGQWNGTASGPIH